GYRESLPVSTRNPSYCLSERKCLKPPLPFFAMNEAAASGLRPFLLPRTAQGFEKAFGLFEWNAVSIIRYPDKTQLRQFSFLKFDAHLTSICIIGVPNKL